MSRRFSKVEETVPLRNAFISKSGFLILGIIAAFAGAFFLGSLFSNIATIKIDNFSIMDKKIRQQQNQIILLTNKYIAMQSYIDSRIQKDEVTGQDMDKHLSYRLNGLNNDVKTKLDQASKNMDHMEAILQSNIDEVNAKIEKLQLSIPASPKIGDPT